LQKKTLNVHLLLDAKQPEYAMEALNALISEFSKSLNHSRPERS